MIDKKLKTNISITKVLENYPDFPYDKNTDLYKGLLGLFSGLGLSKENPFKSYIKPGEIALIKPNWVRDKNPLGFDIDSLITHNSLIKYILDFLVLAMEGKGRIIIADAPLQNCDFENLKKQTKINQIIEKIKIENPNLEIILEDWRLTTMKSSEDGDQIIKDENGFSRDYKMIDLGKESFLEPISKYSERFRVTKYKPSLLLKHHKEGKHEYLVTNRVFEADFVVNLPKMKTHIKAGLTGAMKNLVGINGHKEFLPHHIKGSFFDGGDNYYSKSWFKSKYEDLYDYVWENNNSFSYFKRKILMKILDILWELSLFFGAENISAGSWSGNDTIWRTTLDLNHIMYFGGVKKRNILNVVDGVIAGEGNGPLEPEPKPLGFLIAGENPAYVDACIAKMMGYQLPKIPTVYNAIYNNKSKFGGDNVENIEIILHKNDSSEKIKFDELPIFNFKKPEFWQDF